MRTVTLFTYPRYLIITTPDISAFPTTCRRIVVSAGRAVLAGGGYKAIPRPRLMGACPRGSPYTVTRGGHFPRDPGEHSWAVSRLTLRFDVAGKTAVMFDEFVSISFVSMLVARHQQRSKAYEKELVQTTPGLVYVTALLSASAKRRPRPVNTRSTASHRMVAWCPVFYRGWGELSSGLQELSPARLSQSRASGYEEVRYRGQLGDFSRGEAWCGADSYTYPARYETTKQQVSGILKSFNSIHARCRPGKDKRERITEKAGRRQWSGAVSTTGEPTRTALSHNRLVLAALQKNVRVCRQSPLLASRLHDIVSQFGEQGFGWQDDDSAFRRENRGRIFGALEILWHNDGLAESVSWNPCSSQKWLGPLGGAPSPKYSSCLETCADCLGLGKAPAGIGVKPLGETSGE
ncbi:hypothetical protein Bbelb_067160 [Branchiostoma belcheri]|nr:hypothetical protein Bbelb_067160 [Branchiostoma belcheri]